MREVIYIESFIDLEKEYMKKHNPYLIEEKLLYSFSKKELKNFIEITKDLYLKEKLPYSNRIKKEKLKLNNYETNDLNKYFIDMMSYYFKWWEEIELTKKFLDRLTMFYRVNYQVKNKYKKNLDIKTIPIKQILSQYIKLPNNLRKNIRCPFSDHRDKSASFKVYENNNSFYCYWCHKWWNILNLIAGMEWITTKEAYKKLLNLFW